MRSLSVLLMIIFSLGLGCSDSNDSGSNGSGGNDGFGDTEGPGPDPLIPVDSGCPMQGNPCCEVPATADSLNLCFQSLTTGTIEAGLPPSKLGRELSNNMPDCALNPMEMCEYVFPSQR